MNDIECFIELVSDKEKKAIAWTIAAEGCITISNASGGNIRPLVEVSNTKEVFISKFHSMVGYAGNVYYYKKSNAYLWILTGIPLVKSFCLIKHIA